MPNNFFNSSVFVLSYNLPTNLPPIEWTFSVSVTEKSGREFFIPDNCGRH